MSRVPAGSEVVVGDALDAESITRALRPDDTLVHLVGTPHPDPSKAEEFIRIDLASVRASVTASRRVGISHFIYLSVAQPAPVMHAYVAARSQGEEAIRAAGLTATILRPWYVLGPCHRWPVVLIPLYALAAIVPSWRAGARRLGLVTLAQMVHAIARAVEDRPPSGMIRVLEVPSIRAS